MIKRTLRLLGLPFLFATTIMFFLLYVPVWILGFPIGYIWKNNTLYFYRASIIRNGWQTDRDLKDPLSENEGIVSLPWIPLSKLSNLWRWYWADKPKDPTQPTTF